MIKPVLPSASRRTLTEPDSEHFGAFEAALRVSVSAKSNNQGKQAALLVSVSVKSNNRGQCCAARLLTSHGRFRCPDFMSSGCDQQALA